MKQGELLLLVIAGAALVGGVAVLFWFLPPLLRLEPPPHALAVGAVLGYAAGPMIVGLLLLRFVRKRRRTPKDRADSV